MADLADESTAIEVFEKLRGLDMAVAPVWLGVRLAASGVGTGEGVVVRMR